MLFLINFVQKWLNRKVFQNRTINLQKSLEEAGSRATEVGRMKNLAGLPGYHSYRVARD
jgi:hypothetical protein